MAHNDLPLAGGCGQGFPRQSPAPILSGFEGMGPVIRRFGHRHASLSAVIGILTPVVVFFVTITALTPSPGSRTWPTRKPILAAVALLAAAFTSVSGFEILNDRIVRMYPLAVLLALLSTGMLVIALRSVQGRIFKWGAYGLLATALAYTHYYGLFILAAQALYSVGLLLFGPSSGCNRFRNLLPIGITYSLISLIYLPWLPVLCSQASQVRAAFVLPPLDGSTMNGALEQLLSYKGDILSQPAFLAHPPLS